MNFYHSTHQYYCGIDLHARSLYVCILDQSNKTLLGMITFQYNLWQHRRIFNQMNEAHKFIII